MRITVAFTKLPPLIVLSTICTSICFAQESADKKPVTVPFQFDDIYFAGAKMINTNDLPVTNSTPLVGLKLLKSDFKDFIGKVAGNRSVSDVDKYVTAIFDYLGSCTYSYSKESKFEDSSAKDGLSDLHRTFAVRSLGVDGGVQVTAAQIIDAGKPTESLVLILLPAKTNTALSKFVVTDEDKKQPSGQKALLGQGSYNANYKVTLGLKAIDALAVKAGFKGSPTFMAEVSSKSTIDSDQLSWSGRAGVKVNSNLGLATKDLSSGGKAQTMLLSPDVTYAGVPNPLQGFLFKEQSFYNLDVSGSLFDRSDVKDSQISIKYDGVTDLFRFGDSMTIIGFEMDTQQSLNSVTTYYKPRVRLGDQRSNSSSYVANSNVLNGTYVEAGIDFGYILNRYVPGISKKTDIGSAQWLARPALTLGWKGQSLFGASLDGSINSYYLQSWGSGWTSGSQVTSSVVEVLDTKFTFGPKNQQLVFQVQAGMNPSNGFKNKQTVYAVGVNIKF